MVTLTTAGRSRGGARGARPPLFLDQNETRRAENFFLGDRPPYLRVWMTAPSPPYLKIWIRHWYRPFPGTLSLFAGVGVGVFGRLRQPTQVAS